MWPHSRRTKGGRQGLARHRVGRHMLGITESTDKTNIAKDNKNSRKEKEKSKNTCTGVGPAAQERGRGEKEHMGWSGAWGLEKGPSNYYVNTSQTKEVEKIWI